MAVDGWKWMEMDGWLGGYVDRVRKEFRKARSGCVYKQLSLPHLSLSQHVPKATASPPGGDGGV